MNAADFTVKSFEEQRSELKRQFDSDYRTHCSEIFQFFNPRRGQYLIRPEGSSSTHGPISGRKMHEKVVNSATLLSAKNAASGLQAGVTTPSRPWKKVGPTRPDMNRVAGVAEYYDEVDRGVDSVFAQSNFYRATQTAYQDYVTVGFAALQIDEHEEDVIRCQVHPIGSWFAAPNGDGKIDVFFRDYNPTGHEMLSKFREDELPTELLNNLKKGRFKRIKLRNAITPNPFYRADVATIGLASFPYVSVWWCNGYEKVFIRTHGYHEFPVQVFRMYQAETGDAYGHGIGFDALPDAKQLMFHEDQSSEAVDKMVTPPFQAPTSLKLGGVSLVRGKVTYHDGPGKIEPLYNVNLPVQYVDAKVLRLEQRISQHFFEDLFLMITQSVNRQVTAREIQERHEEKLIMLGPLLESLNAELLDPAIERVIAIMRRANRLPQAPPALVGEPFKIEYISILAQAQRAVKTIAIEQGVNFVSASANAGWPEGLDKINIDPVVDEYLAHIGFPAKAIRPDDEVEARRAAREQMAQQERAVAMAAEAAPAAAAAAQASEQIRPNVLETLLARVPSAAAA